MALIEWSDEYSVGIEKFDTQHKEIISRVNKLHAAVTAGKGNETVAGLLNYLLAHTHSHFFAEELAMARFRVPGQEEHRTEHQKLRSEVMKYAADVSAGRAAISDDTLMFLKSWLIEHIQESDKTYTPHLKDKTF
jgi:hemerythrin-like metal-binding protein